MGNDIRNVSIVSLMIVQIEKPVYDYQGNRVVKPFAVYHSVLLWSWLTLEVGSGLACLMCQPETFFHGNRLGIFLNALKNYVL